MSRALSFRGVLRGGRQSRAPPSGLHPAAQALLPAAPAPEAMDVETRKPGRRTRTECTGTFQTR